jgi:hypothetical protein
MASWPGWIFPMSVSSIGVETCTRLRSAILSSVVPPPTFDVAEAMTLPRDTSISMIVPVIGARTSASCRLMRLFSRVTSADTTAAFALAYVSTSWSCSWTVMA